jgi:large subunit ribosomal protein L7/L12
MLRRVRVCNAHRTTALLQRYSSSVVPMNTSSASNPLALHGFQLYNRCTNNSSQSLHVRSFAVPKGMCAVGVPSSSATVEHIASQYAEAMTLADMSRFHQAVVKNAQQTQQFYEKTLLKGFGDGGGGGGVVSARPLAAGAAQPVAAASISNDAAADVPKQKAVAAKTSFNVQLAKFDPSIKIKLIKELRTVTNLPLGEAKAAIDKCPGLVASNMNKEDADRLKKVFEDLGATVELL